MNNKLSKKEMSDNARAAICRLESISEMLDGLQGGLLQDNADGVLHTHDASYGGIPAEYINAYDWINGNYDLIANIIRETGLTIHEQCELIDPLVTNISYECIEDVCQEDTAEDADDIQEDAAEDADDIQQYREFIEKAYIHAINTIDKDETHKECAEVCKLIYGEEMKPTSGGYLHIMGFLMGVQEGMHIADVFNREEKERG